MRAFHDERSLAHDPDRYFPPRRHRRASGAGGPLSPSARRRRIPPHADAGARPRTRPDTRGPRPRLRLLSAGGVGAPSRAPRRRRGSPVGPFRAPAHAPPAGRPTGADRLLHGGHLDPDPRRNHGTPSTGPRKVGRRRRRRAPRGSGAPTALAGRPGTTLLPIRAGGGFLLPQQQRHRRPAPCAIAHSPASRS